MVQIIDFFLLICPTLISTKIQVNVINLSLKKYISTKFNTKTNELSYNNYKYSTKLEDKINTIKNINNIFMFLHISKYKDVA